MNKFELHTVLMFRVRHEKTFAVQSFQILNYMFLSKFIKDVCLCMHLFVYASMLFQLITKCPLQMQYDPKMEFTRQ